MEAAGEHSLQLKAGTPLNPSDLNPADIRIERQGFFDKMKKAFGAKIESELTVGIRPLGSLLAAKQVYKSFIENLI